MEKLPFADQSFDLIVSAGSLSYRDNDIVMNEIYRVLKLQGVFIRLVYPMLPVSA
jgi:ubiquinone/menaquinone biosynthesis C-methylase UbiE